MNLTTLVPTRLHAEKDLPKRQNIPAGETLTILARIYGGKVLKVLYEGREWYMANPDWVPPEVTESIQQSLSEPIKTLPWDRPPKRGRGRPRKEKTQ